ncbi:ribonuclease Z [Teredinibacter sp. KSP-S5-2]|uniref:ribonuclease Z n=1 Tax=Teredinibacter sp. KSP-S5-2 TaxID=3034506 RepID=UPI00293513CE|nr:ribonuclease Z [Teredinibacter sp. KSP-S5-2]WNO10867.1 ribonuclease Z [Teredinibacter sp. KSP-S5-2]
MELTFLGTSSGTPTKTRNVSGAAVSLRDSKKWCLVDCGEGTQHQISLTRYSLIHLQAIFISHVHGDHCYGLPGLLASAAMAGRDAPLKIICPAGVRNFMQSIIAETEMHLSYELEYIDVAVKSLSVALDEVVVEVIPLSHRVPSFGFRFSEVVERKKKLNTKKLISEGIAKGELWGRIQKGEDVSLEDGRQLKSAEFLTEVERSPKLIVCGDNDSPELLKPYMEGVDIVVHEATYTEDVAAKVGNVPQHSYAKKVAAFAQEVGLKNLILTHFSPRYTDDIDRFPSVLNIEDEAKSVFVGNIFLAKDLDCYWMNNKGEVSLNKVENKMKPEAVPPAF